METAEILNKEFDGKVKTKEPIASYTSFKIGGPAEYYFQAHSLTEIEKAVSIAKKLKLPFIILARGSNVLISDQGFKGLVIHNKAKEIIVKDTTIISDSGVNLSTLANTAKINALSGLEFTAGIPGSVGGAVRGNAGAWRMETKDVLEKAVVLTEQGKIEERKNQDCQFGYRESIFKRNNEVILQAVFHLQKSTPEKIQKKIDEIVAQKRYEQEFESPSAGCVFKNPKVSFSEQELKSRGLDPVKVKHGRIPAGYLIEELGLKGFKIGKAMISEVHANFIINLGGATAEEIIMLIGIIKQKVRTKFGIQLQEEIQYVGF